MAGIGRLRLVRAGAAAILLLVLLSAQRDLAELAPPRYVDEVRAGILAVAALAGLLAIHDGVGALTRTLDLQATMIVRNLSTWTLYVLLAAWVSSAAGVNLSGLLVGGAIFGVVIAAASQASLGNFFSGLVLMMARPYRVGSSVRMHGPGLGNVEYEGTVLDMGAVYTTMTTAAGEVVKLPNSAVVSSVLVLGDAPLQADIEVALPPGTALRPIESALRERLQPAASAVTVRPRALEAGPDGKLAVQVQVRSTAAVDPAAVAEALAQAMAESGGAEPTA